MKTSYFASKFLHLLFAVYVLTTICAFNVTAQVFRKYTPPTYESNVGRCIIRMNSSDDYLFVGTYGHTNLQRSGHTIWVDDDGVLLDERNYDNGTDENDPIYDFKMIANTQVQGSYSTTFPYTPRYQGYPVVGSKTVDSPSGKLEDAFVGILNPVSKQIVWSHLIVTGFNNRGISVIVDNNEPNSFYVLSQSSIMSGSNYDYDIAIAKFKWTPGDAGHQLVWSKSYYNNSSNQYYATGLTQKGNQLIVVGNQIENSTPAYYKIFTIPFNKSNGNPGVLTYYRPAGNELYDVKANSIVYNALQDEYVVAGSSSKNGIAQPMLMRINSAFGCIESPIYNDLQGEFMYANIFQHGIGNPASLPAYYITAVGTLSNGEACMMNVNETNLNTVNWTTAFNYDFSSGSATSSTAEWFDADFGTGGHFMCVGIYTTLSPASVNVLTGVVQKNDGFTQCGNYPSVEPVEDDLEEFTTELDYEEWESTPHSITEWEPELAPYYCYEDNTYYGKSSSNDSKAQVEKIGFFTLTHTDNSAQLVLNLTDESDVEIIITDIIGNIHVQKKVHEYIGSHNLTFDISNLSSGAYVFYLRVNGKSYTQTLSVVK